MQILRGERSDCFDTDVAGFVMIGVFAIMP